MPIYEIEGPEGTIFELEGDTPPTESELEQVFASFKIEPTQQAQPVRPSTELEGVDLSVLPQERQLSPIEQEEQRFQETVVPQQQVAQQAREQAATERRARREAGELTTGERIEDILLTRDVTESAAPGAQLGAEVAGLTSLPARALGYRFGDISDESSKILKPAIEAVNEWTNSP